jgi:membrane protease YdiL (CAAX protease family)
MIKKIRSFTDQRPIIAAFAIFLAIEIIFLACATLLSLLPKNLPMDILHELIMIILPIALVFFFGYERLFKKGKFFRGLICALPYILWMTFTLVHILTKKFGNPEATWQSWYMIAFGLFSALCVGIREECIYRGVIQNVIAKKYANSVKGVWITVLLSSLFFGLCHVSNLLAGMNPLAVLTQVINAAIVGLLVCAAYLRSGSIWAVILVHALTDTVSLSKSIFFVGFSEVEVANQQLSYDWATLIMNLIFIGITAFLLRPSKCKQIYESLPIKDEKSEEVPNT